MKSALPVVACDLTVFSPAERKAHVARAEGLMPMGAAEELPDGFAFSYPDRPGLVRDIGAFVEGERRCCPFFTFELRVEPSSARVTLTIKGPPEGKEALRSGLERMKEGFRGPDAEKALAVRTGARV